MRRLVALIAIVTLAGCAGVARDVRGDSLADYDLSSSAVTVALIQNLDDADRAPFRQFLVHHMATSAGFCGEALFDEQGAPPATIGDAIRLTRLREERLAMEGQPFDAASLTPEARRAIELDRLHRRRGELNDLIANAEMAGDPRTIAENRQRIAQITEQIDRLSANPI